MLWVCDMDDNWVLLLLTLCTRLKTSSVCGLVVWAQVRHALDTLMVLCSRVFIQCYGMKLLRNLYPCKCFIVAMAMKLHVVRQRVVFAWTSKVWDIHTRTFPVRYPRSDWRFGAAPGKFLSIVGQDPCDSKSIRPHVDIINLPVFLSFIRSAVYRFL